MAGEADFLSIMKKIRVVVELILAGILITPLMDGGLPMELRQQVAENMRNW
jgi:hypothetical protein